MIGWRRIILLSGSVVLLGSGSCVRSGWIAELPRDGAVSDRRGPETATPGEAGSDQATCEGTSFGASTRLASVSALAKDDWEPALSADGLELFLASWRAGGKGKSDIWRATRPSLTAEFSTPVPVPELNSAGYDADPWIAADGRTLLLVSDRDGQQGGIHIAHRSDPSGPFSEPAKLTELVTGQDDDWCPVLVDGGLRLYFSSARAGGQGKQDIWVTTRPSTTAAFGSPQNLAALNPASNELVESVSPDGKELFFASDRAGGAGMFDLYVVSLSAPSTPVGSPRNLAVLNSARDDVGGALGPDGREFLYNRDSLWDLGGADSDIWTSTRSCAP